MKEWLSGCCTSILRHPVCQSDDACLLSCAYRDRDRCVVLFQTKLRAACLGVKIRAENGLENALDSLSLFARESELLPTVSTAAQVEAEPPHQPNSMVADTGTAQPRGEHQLVLRDMPNGLRVWWSSRAEEEAFFVFGEVFEDRTYARMGIRVQDGDTVWDVGEIADIGKFSKASVVQDHSSSCIKNYDTVWDVDKTAYIGKLSVGYVFIGSTRPPQWLH